MPASAPGNRPTDCGPGSSPGPWLRPAQPLQAAASVGPGTRLEKVVNR